eukprot:534381_1
MATSALTGKKRSITESQIDDSNIDSSDTSTKRRKIFIENNIIIGINTIKTENVSNAINELTKELSSENVIKSNYVLICNIDAVIEHCDIIDLCKDISFPIALNYFRGTFGKAWLKFETHQIALKIVNKLNEFELENRKLMVGLINNTPKYIDIKQALTNYNLAKGKVDQGKNNRKRKRKFLKKKVGKKSQSSKKK